MSEQEMSGHGQISYEGKDLRFRPIVWASIGLALITLVFCALMWVFFAFLSAREASQSPAPNPLAAAEARTEPPSPRLLVDPVASYHEFKQQEEVLLNSYGWVDKEAGLVHVPIERAIKTLAAQGLPSYDAAAERERARNEAAASNGANAAAAAGTAAQGSATQGVAPAGTGTGSGQAAGRQEHGGR